MSIDSGRGNISLTALANNVPQQKDKYTSIAARIISCIVSAVLPITMNVRACSAFDQVIVSVRETMYRHQHSQIYYYRLRFTGPM